MAETDQKQERTLAIINQEYGNICALAGQLWNNTKKAQAQLEAYGLQMLKLEEEGAKVAEEDKKKSETAPADLPAGTTSKASHAEAPPLN